jgi:hypothetical protein
VTWKGFQQSHAFVCGRVASVHACEKVSGVIFPYGRPYQYPHPVPKLRKL